MARFLRCGFCGLPRHESRFEFGRCYIATTNLGDTRDPDSHLGDLDAKLRPYLYRYRAPPQIPSKNGTSHKDTDSKSNGGNAHFTPSYTHPVRW